MWSLNVSDVIVSMARKHVEDFQSEKSSGHRCRRDLIQSSGRGLNLMKMNTDATCRSGYGTRMGAVLRDHDGGVILVMAQLINSSLSINIVEIHAVRAGLIGSLQEGVRRIIVEMDSRWHFVLCKGRKEDILYFEGIVAEFFELCGNFESYSFSRVRRTANEVVHKLAQFVYSCDSVNLRFRR